MTTNPRRNTVLKATVSCAALFLLATMSVGAASDVADAVQNGDATAVRRLVTAKADVNAPQADGATALHWAVYRDDVATVDLLLKAGANPKAANSFGATPLSMAAETGSHGRRAAPARGRRGRERAHCQPRHGAHDGRPERQRRNDQAAARPRCRRERDRERPWHHGVDVGRGSGACAGRPVARRPRRGRQVRSRPPPGRTGPCVTARPPIRGRRKGGTRTWS